MTYYLKLEGFEFGTYPTFAEAYEAMTELEKQLGGDGFYITTRENA